MSAGVLVLRRESTSVGIAQASELTRPVNSLAIATSECMATLDALHVAISKTYGPSAQQTALFSEVKLTIGQEWERWLSFLQRSLAYTRNFILLCENFESSGPVTVNALIIADARLIETEAQSCQKSYSSVLQTFASLVQRYDPPRSIQRRNQSVVASRSVTQQRKYIVLVIISLVIGDFCTEKSPKQQKPRKPPAKRLHNLPIILHAFVIANATLQTSQQCLRDIVAFWSNHVSYVSKLTSPQQVDRTAQARQWRAYQSSMRQALSDITAHCDALTVKPTARSAVRPVSLWLNDTLPDTGALESLKIQEVGYFEALTSPSQFNVNSVFKTAHLARSKLSALLPKSEPPSTAKNSQAQAQFSSLPPDLEPHVTSGLEALSVIYGIATSGTSFYVEALNLLKSDTPNSNSLAVMRSEAGKVHSQLRIVIPRLEDVKSRLYQSLSVSHNNNMPMKKNLRLAANVVQRLVALLVDFDHCWFGLAVGVEYMGIKPVPNIAGRKKPQDIWSEQKYVYEGYRKLPLPKQTS